MGSNIWEDINKNKLAARGMDLKIFNWATVDPKPMTQDHGSEAEIIFIDPEEEKAKHFTQKQIDEGKTIKDPWMSMTQNSNMSLKARNDFLMSLKNKVKNKDNISFEDIHKQTNQTELEGDTAVMNEQRIMSEIEDIIENWEDSNYDPEKEYGLVDETRPPPKTPQENNNDIA